MNQLSENSPFTDEQAQFFAYHATVKNHIDFYSFWAGWRMRGRYLISPDGDRITVERLRGILYKECTAQSIHKLKIKKPASVYQIKDKGEKPFPNRGASRGAGIGDDAALL